MRGIVIDHAAAVVAGRGEEHFKCRAIEYILTGMNFVAQIDARLVIGIQNRVQRRPNSVNAVSISPAGRCGHG